MALPKSGERAKAAFDASVLGSEGLALGFPVPRILGESPSIKEIRDTIRKLSKVNSPVLITGETGTGKELVARAIHALSPRARSPYMTLNCAAVPEELFESELFGHLAGAFTGALAERAGLLQSCHGGTFLLDEIGELPLRLQAKLLRVLEFQSVRQVGADRESPIDVRILAATNRDLKTEVEAGRFRADLFFRLNGSSVFLPPLRSRGNDVLLLAESLAKAHADQANKHIHDLSRETADVLLHYAWPGNIRELRNCMEHAVAVAQQETIQVEDLLQEIREGAGGNDLGGFPSLADVIRRHVNRALEMTRGNRTEAARLLKVDPKTLWRKLKSYEGTD